MVICFEDYKEIQKDLFKYTNELEKEITYVIRNR